MTGLERLIEVIKTMRDTSTSPLVTQRLNELLIIAAEFKSEEK